MSEPALALDAERARQLYAWIEKMRSASTDRVDEIRRQQGINSLLLGKVVDALTHIRAVRDHLRDTDLDRPREEMERTLDEAGERAAVAFSAFLETVMLVEMRVDLDGRDDVTVLAEARERIRRRA